MGVPVRVGDGRAAAFDRTEHTPRTSTSASTTSRWWPSAQRECGPGQGRPELGPRRCSNSQALIDTYGTRETRGGWGSDGVGEGGVQGVHGPGAVPTEGQPPEGNPQHGWWWRRGSRPTLREDVAARPARRKEVATAVRARGLLECRRRGSRRRGGLPETAAKTPRRRGAGLRAASCDALDAEQDKSEPNVDRMRAKT